MPRLYLAIDNCFAAKRWTDPADWARVVADLGLNLVEASADTENDPHYHGREYQRRWAESVRTACAGHGLRVANLYSGHGTYATLGLWHPDPHVADRMLNEWLKPQIDVAPAVAAGLGFYVHAFPISVIERRPVYEAAVEALVDRLAAVAWYAGRGPAATLPWLGTAEAYLLARDAATADASPAADDAWNRVQAIVDAHPHLFARPNDGDPYAWLAALGAYSPIIHLQQTDGTRSAHLPFAEANNQSGIITAPRVLAALQASYRSPRLPASIPPVEEIYLTIEVFLGTAANPYAALQELRQTVSYWRRFIPEDGIELETACTRSNG